MNPEPSSYHNDSQDGTPSGVSELKATLAAVLEEIPTNWCDPLLTGPKAVIGSPPYTGKDLENLVLGIRARIESKFKADNAK